MFAIMLEVASVYFPDTVLAESRETPDRAGASFVTYHPDRKVEAAAFAVIALVGNAHTFSSSYIC